MSTLDSILGLLQKWPQWKRLTETPDHVDKLEQRVAALEAKLRQPVGDMCPKCRQPAFQLVGSKKDPTFGDLGVSLRQYRCSSCGFEESKQVH